MKAKKAKLPRKRKSGKRGKGAVGRPASRGAAEDARRQVEVDVGEVFALRLQASAAYVQSAQAEVALAQERLAHARTKAQHAQAKHEAVLAEVSKKGPVDHEPLSLLAETRTVLFVHKDDLDR